MLKRHLLLASVLAGTFAITACSQQTEENTGDAIAESTNTAVENTAEAVADGANAVADGANDVAVDAEQQY